MGKVRRLRKKYHALCVKNNNSTNDKNERTLKYVDSVKKDFFIDSDITQNLDFDTKSVCSISKSIKSNLSGLSILKKDKKKLRHELFLKRLETSAEIFSKIKKNKTKIKKRDLNVNLPQLCMKKEKRKNSDSFIHKNLNIKMNTSSTQKGLMKRRNAQMIQDVNLFRKILDDETITENPHEKIQRHTLEQLSRECLE